MFVLNLAISGVSVTWLFSFKSRAAAEEAARAALPDVPATVEIRDDYGAFVRLPAGAVLGASVLDMEEVADIEARHLAHRGRVQLKAQLSLEADPLVRAVAAAQQRAAATATAGLAPLN